MALTQVDGSLTVTTSVTELFASQTTLQTYATAIFVDNLASGDTIQITIFINDPNDGDLEKIYDQFLVSNAQTKPAIYIPPLPTNSYRITAQKISGTDRVVTWVRSEYT